MRRTRMYSLSMAHKIAQRSPCLAPAQAAFTADGAAEAGALDQPPGELALAPRSCAHPGRVSLA